MTAEHQLVELKALVEQARDDAKAARELLQGREYDRSDRGLVGEVHDLRVELHGPDDHPNGLVGRIDQNRASTRMAVVGIAVTAGGALLLRVLGVT